MLDHRVMYVSLTIFFPIQIDAKADSKIRKFSFPNRCYYLFSNRKVSLFEAKNECQSRGYNLASFPLPSDISTFTQMLINEKISAYILIGLQITEYASPGLFR